jgi:hypothetical protein
MSRTIAATTTRRDRKRALPAQWEDRKKRHSAGVAIIICFDRLRDVNSTEISRMESVLAATQGDLLEDILKLPAPPRFHCHCDRFAARATA